MLVAAAALVPGGAATGSSPGPLLTYVLEPVDIGYYGIRVGFCSTDLQGHNFRVTDPVTDLSPAWSPDGRWVAFLRVAERLNFSPPPGTDLIVANSQGQDERVLTEDTARGAVSGPAWSPDGRRLAFLARDLSTVLSIVNIDGSPGSTLQLDDQASFSGKPSWSPDGRELLFSVYANPSSEFVSGIYSMAADGSNVQLVLKSASRPMWAPDGRHFAYYANAPGTLGPPLLGVADADGSNAHLFLETTQASWSPDGTRLVYVTPKSDLAIVQADGSGTQLLTRGGFEPAWSPDGKLIAFTEHVHLSPRVVALAVAVIRPDGTGERVLATDGLGAADPAWGPAETPAKRRPCVVHGTPRADVIRGTGGGDVIFGGRGNDTIYGRGGPDVLMGNLGHDRLYGGASDDTFAARDRQEDLVVGGSGADDAFHDRVDRLFDIEVR
jgi:hypothetical protein